MLKKILKTEWLTILSGFCFILVLLFTSSGFTQIYNRFTYEVSGKLNHDSSLYLAVGRGLMNGKPLYSGLFENKPPGIFLIGAASLSMTGDGRLATWLQGLALLLIALSVAMPVLIFWKRKRVSWVIPFTGIAFGSLLAMYCSIRAGFFQVEPFGAAFACLYAALLSLTGERPMRLREIIFAAFLISFSVFMKEPFLLIIMGIALVLLPTPSLLYRNAVLPILLAGVFFFIFLLMTGSFEPYINIYLREMLFVHTGKRGALIDRIFNFSKVFNDLRSFSPWLIGSIGILIMYACFERLRSASGALSMLKVQIAIFLAVFTIALGGDFYGHHFVFAAPLYAALALRFFQAYTMQNRRFVLTLAPLFIFIIIGIHSLPVQSNKNNIKRAQIQNNNAITVARKIDDLLLACNVGNYLFIGPNNVYPYAFTKHSPIGPLFFQYSYYLNGLRPYFSQWFEEQIDEAQIIVWSKDHRLGAGENWVRDRISASFTRDPWDCAQNVDLGADYALIFRRRTSSSHDLALLTIED